jgi:hypothetical protein
MRPEMKEWIPEEFSMLPCGNVWFFNVPKVEKEQIWIEGCPQDSHLDADVAVVDPPTGGKRNRFDIATIMGYKHWTGPLFILRSLDCTV